MSSSVCDVLCRAPAGDLAGLWGPAGLGGGCRGIGPGLVDEVVGRRGAGSGGAGCCLARAVVYFVLGAVPVQAGLTVRGRRGTAVGVAVADAGGAASARAGAAVGACAVAGAAAAGGESGRWSCCSGGCRGPLAVLVMPGAAGVRAAAGGVGRDRGLDAAQVPGERGGVRGQGL